MRARMATRDGAMVERSVSVMRDAAVLASIAARLNREAGKPPIPTLFFFTDPARTPHPLQSAARLPRGSAVVYRHFGAKDREKVAFQLAALCKRRSLVLLIGADLKLAQKVRAGVHWPERLMPASKRTQRLETTAAHSPRALARAARAGFDAAVLSPVFPSKSKSAQTPLGPLRAMRLARAAALPVIALGGINARNGAQLSGRGFAGVAAIDGLK
jgi:thiamine-phosphate pyrophosphorylase